MKSTRKTVEKTVIHYLETHEIKKGSVIISAYSGGPDSTAMVSILNNLTGWNFRIICAYYNHGLRSKDELEREADILKQFTQANQLELVCGYAGAGEVLDYSSRNNLSIEEAARDKRYSFLESLRSERRADYISTGHHLDDNSETMLMRFLQNSGVSGLSGIPPERGRIIRPLLGVGKDLIDRLIFEEEIICSRDETNLEENFLRNKLRHRLIPVIKEIIPEFSHNMSSLSEKVRLYNDFVEEECRRRLVWSETAKGWKIRSKTFFNVHPLLRIQSAYLILNNIQTTRRRIRFAALEAAIGDAEPENGKVLLRTGDFEVVRRNDYIFIERLVNHNKKSYLLQVEPEKYYKISGQIFQLFHASDAAAFKEELPSAALRTPIIVRSYIEGDRISIKSGSKSIKKIFNEWKVSKDERNLIPVIEDPSGIAAVIGGHLGFENQIASGRNTPGDGQEKILIRFNIITETTGE